MPDLENDDGPESYQEITAPDASTCTYHLDEKYCHSYAQTRGFGFSTVSSDALSPGCLKLDTGAVVYNSKHDTPADCTAATVEKCVCSSVAIYHALGEDMLWKQNLNIPSLAKTKVYHRHRDDHGMVRAGDWIRYIRVTAMAATACASAADYSDTPDVDGKGFGGVLQEDAQGIFVYVNLPDTNELGPDNPDFEFCFVDMNSARRKLQVVANPWTRGGGLISVTRSEPPA